MIIPLNIIKINGGNRVNDIIEIIEAYMLGFELVYGNNLYHRADGENSHVYYLNPKPGLLFRPMVNLISVSKEITGFIISKRFAMKEEIDYGYKTCYRHNKFGNEIYFYYKNSDIKRVKDVLKNYEEYFTRIINERGMV